MTQLHTLKGSQPLIDPVESPWHRRFQKTLIWLLSLTDLKAFLLHSALAIGILGC